MKVKEQYQPMVLGADCWGPLSYLLKSILRLKTINKISLTHFTRLL